MGWWFGRWGHFLRRGRVVVRTVVGRGFGAALVAFRGAVLVAQLALSPSQPQRQLAHLVLTFLLQLNLPLDLFDFGLLVGLELLIQ